MICWGIIGVVNLRQQGAIERAVYFADLALRKTKTDLSDLQSKSQNCVIM